MKVSELIFCFTTLKSNNNNNNKKNPKKWTLSE